MGGDHHGSHGEGHGHGHHDHGFRKVPDWRSYKVENAPELMTVRNVLAQKGLKDPWLRNEVWRWERSEWGTYKQRWALTLFRGFKWGFLAFVATISIDQGLKMINPPAEHHGSSSHH